MSVIEKLRSGKGNDPENHWLMIEAADEIERLRSALEKYDCLHKCTEPCALYHMEKAKEDMMPHMICGWWASEALMEKSK